DCRETVSGNSPDLNRLAAAGISAIPFCFKRTNYPEPLENHRRMYMMLGFGDSLKRVHARFSMSASLRRRAMRSKRPDAGSTAVAFTFSLFLVVLTFVTVFLFLSRVWPLSDVKIWFPPAITDFGSQIDAQFHRTLVITGVIFVLAQL